ncbi:MAG TPA: hypothetical protein DCF84_08860 [Bacteroidetes bacterium]|nr:hypothetical protein [Bacteroidota bacterium]
MMVLLSPSKTMELTSHPTLTPSQPIFEAASNEVWSDIQGVKKDELRQWMKLSPALTEAVYTMYHAETRQQGMALWSYTGTAFSGLNAQTLSPDTLRYAQDHLGILSALYGILRPLDSLCQYRLEMALRSPKTNVAYHDFWRKRNTEVLHAHVNALDTKYLLNLMSAEYSKSVDWNLFPIDVVSCSFLQKSPKGLKNVAVHSKRARGLMARYVMEHRIHEINCLKKFSVEDYQFSEAESSEDLLVFIR